jgi:hypothetical protein
MLMNFNTWYRICVVYKLSFDVSAASRKLMFFVFVNFNFGASGLILQCRSPDYSETVNSN